MKLDSEQQEKELLQAVRIAGGGKKAKQRQKSRESERYTLSSDPLNVSCRSYGCKGRRKDSIKVTPGAIESGMMLKSRYTINSYSTASLQ